MINPLVKLIHVDGFFDQEHAVNIQAIVSTLNFVESEFGKELPNFNLVSNDADEMFTAVFNTKFEVDKERSGVIRKPARWIHFEGFDNTNEWVFACALDGYTTFDVFEHVDGAATALDGYKYNYQDLFQWDLRTNILLKPGQGILFRPWLFHSFSSGMIQVFRLREVE